MALHRLRYFVVVAEERHFGRAALRLGIAQPPLSQQIAKLERSLGFPLFFRTTRRVDLTDAGTAFLDTARATLERLQKGVENARRIAAGDLGQLTVGFPASLSLGILPLVIRRYRRHAPGVRLHLREMTTTLQLAALASGTIDVGFLREAQPEGPDYVSEAVLAERFIVVLPSRHRLARKSRVPVDALRRESFILFPRSAGPEFHDRILSLCGSGGFQPRIAQEAVEWQTVLSLVGEGLGISIAPGCVRRLRWPKVTFRPLSPASQRTRVFLCHRANRTSPILSGFKAVLRECIARERGQGSLSGG